MSIKLRMYPTPEQVSGMVMHCSHARYLYNIALEQRNLWRPGHPRLTGYDQKRQLTEARREFAWLRAGASVVQQQAVLDLDRAFLNWWHNPQHFSRPTFRKAGINEGFCVRDLSMKRLNRKWLAIHVPKVGFVKVRLSRLWHECQKATSARVTLKNGRWHISLTTPPRPKTVAGTGAVIGIDRGVTRTLAYSDGEFSQMPTLTAGEQRRFLALEQKLARQTRDAKKAKRPFAECRNRKKTLISLSAIRERLNNRRKDWVEQTTTRLARTYDLIAIEDLRTRSMTRKPKPKPDTHRPGVFLSNGARAKAKLNRLILASRWSEFATRLGHKTDGLVLVDPRFSSQQCHACGHASPDNRESQAVFICRGCGHRDNADTNAAKNILNRGLPEPEDIGGSPVSVALAPQEPARKGRRAA